MTQQQTTKTTTTSPPTALKKSQKARKLWLSAETTDELLEVERLFKEALNAKTSASSAHHKNNKISKQRRVQYAELSPSEYRKTGEYLSLLYCQSGRTLQAKKGLEYLGFTCRLSKCVLDYPTKPPVSNKLKRSKKNRGISPEDLSPPCIILDNFLHESELQHLQSTFQDLQANYWTSHSYQIEPPTPYFSYVIDLHRSGSVEKEYGFIAKLANQMRQSPELQAKFPSLRQARFVEMWAHNRPHASGHQLHFDSDDEGRGGKIRNPICSTILYLSDDENDTADVAAGGPSLVTNQRLSSTHLATQGWLAHPKALRLVAFDGTVLHGVIPGKGAQPGRRVTLMMAFWKQIRVRDEPTQGSARPFPTANHSESLLDWAIQLTDPTIPISNNRPCTMKETTPLVLPTVYETLDGEPWKASYGMPDYEQVFQGF